MAVFGMSSGWIEFDGAFGGTIELRSEILEDRDQIQVGYHGFVEARLSPQGLQVPSCFGTMCNGLRPWA